MYLVKRHDKETFSIPCKEISPSDIKTTTSPLAQKIIKKLTEKSYYPKELAYELNVHEQKIYYHIRKLEKAKIIKKEKTETKQGAIAQYYSLTKPSFAIRFKDFEFTQKIAEYSNESEFLEPFIENGQLNATIVVGNPNPHGPQRARARDGYYGIDFALFLGTFLQSINDLKVRLDTEVREKELKNNLIVLGGPITNNIAKKINRKSPIKFIRTRDGIIIGSTISKKQYLNDEIGFIVKMPNPFDKSKKLLYIAGNRYPGTRACIIAFLKKFKEISGGNRFNPEIEAKVVEGYDMDSDGIVDEVEIKE
ncbi:MAG: helix-turn-helix domain-containing protein [archaeon]|nr:helix-turn-helix domain-containing protein [archaeon]